MKHFLFIVCLFYGLPIFGQTNCPIDFVPNSNEILYNEAVVDSILKPQNYDAFFFGESHTDDFEPEFKYNLIKHLNSKYGVKDIFMEIGYACSYFFNQYLQTGDTSIFHTNHLLYWRRGYKMFWAKLYAYNQTLPDSLKIVIHGVDFERTEIFGFLESIRNKNVVTPIYLQNAFDDFHRLAYNNRFWDDKAAQKIVKDIKGTFLQYTEDYIKLYGDKFNIVEDVLTNNTPATITVNGRNKAWYQNVRKIIVKNNIKKMIAFFGGSHTTYNNKTSLAITLKNTDFFKGNIINIATIYTHSRNPINAGETVDYNYGERATVDSFYNPRCRAVIVKAEKVPKTGFKTASDYIVFAKETVIE